MRCLITEENIKVITLTQTSNKNFKALGNTEYNYT